MLLLVLAGILIKYINCAKILGVFMSPSYSHQIVYQPIWKELSLRGHEVTILTPNPLHDPTLTNLTEIDLNFSYATVSSTAMSTHKAHSTADEVAQFFHVFSATGIAQLNYPPVQDIIKNRNNETYDLLLVEMLFPLMYAFKDIYKCPMVGISSAMLPPFSYDAIGNPINPALDPEPILPFSTDLSFIQRVVSTVTKIFIKTNFDRNMADVEKLKTQYFGVKKSLTELSQEVSLIIVNSNLAFQNVKPVLPALVEISGIHIKKNQPLPGDLQKFMDDSEAGVIYFSLGTNVKSATLPEKQMEIIMQVFAELPYQILLKFDNRDLPNKPKNVEIKKWLPQQDLLRHRNLKLFITQAGLQSIDEAILNEVPVLAIPFWGDQKYNAHHLVASGGGLMIDFHSFTKEELKQKIMALIQNEKYKHRMSTLAKIAKDQPMAALEKSIWWIEYVLRHDGAPHLRYKGMDMPLYQYLLLDVYLFIFLTLSLNIYIIFKIVNYVMSCIFVRSLRKSCPSVHRPHVD